MVLVWYLLRRLERVIYLRPVKSLVRRHYLVCSGHWKNYTGFSDIPARELVPFIISGSVIAHLECLMVRFGGTFSHVKPFRQRPGPGYF